jgi:hypothetical protein
MCFIFKNDHDFKSCQNMLIILMFILLYDNLQLCFRHLLHWITFTCHKGLMNQIDLKFQFLGKNIKLWIPYILSFFFLCLIIPYYYKKNQHQKVFIFENQGPFVKLVMFDGTPTQL